MSFDELIATCAYKDPVELSESEVEIWQHERAMCQLDFMHFLKWVRIIQPPTPGQTGSNIMPIQLWEHTRTVIATLLSEPLISVLKARQIGLSTIIAAYILWYALSKLGASIMLFSKGQAEAKELLMKAHRMYDLLPNFLKFKIDPDSTEEMGFPQMKSVIRALPSSPTAGISYTSSIVVADEHAAHAYADENYISSKPTRDAGGQFISVFTEDPYSNDNLATAIFLDALEKKNDFVPLFFPWDVVPGRDTEWYERTRRNIPDRELGRISPDLYMAKNYPSSIAEALSLAESVVVFKRDVLNKMSEDVRGHINAGEKWEEENIDCKICHIYQDYHIGDRYVAGSDVGQGLGQDFSVTTVLNVRTGAIVADIMTNDIPPEEFAYHSVMLLRHYQSPKWWIEHNITGGGRAVIKKAVELGYKKLGYRGKQPISWSRIEEPDTLKRVGFFTDQKNREDLFGALIPGVNDYQLRIFNRSGIKQFYSIIRNANKEGKIEATGGEHDDYVVAVGIAWLKRKEILTNLSQMEAVKTLDFNTGNIDPRIAKLIGRE